MLGIREKRIKIGMNNLATCLYRLIVKIGDTEQIIDLLSNTSSLLYYALFIRKMACWNM